ncbi:MAG TPA: hypothetical protein GX528_03500 [Firmicutes bacterium]|nr:hypothetical protein [Bacillota bacterium]
MPFSRLASRLETFPQVLVNVPAENPAQWLENEEIKQALFKAEKKMQPLGRIFVRASGTEPLIRILGEHPDEKIVRAAVDYLADVIRAEQKEIARAN